MHRIVKGVAFVAALAFASAANAEETIKIGVLMPLSGNAASAGQQSKSAIELAVEIINGKHPEITGMPEISSLPKM